MKYFTSYLLLVSIFSFTAISAADAGFTLLKFQKPTALKIKKPKRPELKGQKVKITAGVRGLQDDPNNAFMRSQTAYLQTKATSSQALNRAQSLTPSRGIASAQKAVSKEVTSQQQKQLDHLMGRLLK